LFKHVLLKVKLHGSVVFLPKIHPGQRIFVSKAGQKKGQKKRQKKGAKKFSRHQFI
jgi:hypothetical protein